MAAFAIFCRVLLLVFTAAATLLHRRLLPPLRRRRLHRYDAAILSMVLGASALFHAVATGPNDDDIHALAAAGFLIWVAGVALLLLALAPGRFPGPGAAAPARVAVQLVAVGALF
jgi:hypothetical protein